MKKIILKIQMPDDHEELIPVALSVYHRFCQWFNTCPYFTNQVTPIWQQSIPLPFLFYFFETVGIKAFIAPSGEGTDNSVYVENPNPGYNGLVIGNLVYKGLSGNMNEPLNIEQATFTHTTREAAEIETVKKCFLILEELTP